MENNIVEIYGYSIATVPAIIAIIYGVIEFFKSFVFCGNETFKKYIPIVATVFGGVVSLIAFFAFPEIIPAANWYSAVLIGCASGLSSVGINQIKKQIQKGGGDNGGS